MVVSDNGLHTVHAQKHVEKENKVDQENVTTLHQLMVEMIVLVKMTK